MSEKSERTYSVVMATYNKGWALPQVLESLLHQVGDGGEVIVVDDGSTDDTPEILQCWNIRSVRLNDALGQYRNSCIARNVGYRMAKGDVVVAQSDDVVHVGDTIKPLVDGLEEGTIHIASVWDYHNGKRGVQYTGVNNQRPLFFLGSLWRKDLYAVGGNDQDFRFPGCEDVWHGTCLTKGLGLKTVYREDVIGHHQHHRQAVLSDYGDGPEIHAAKNAAGVYVSSGGPWIYGDGLKDEKLP